MRRIAAGTFLALTLVAVPAGAAADLPTPTDSSSSRTLTTQASSTTPSFGARPGRAGYGRAGGPVLTRMLDEDTDPRTDGYAVGAVPQFVCNDVCVHWVLGTSNDAVADADQNTNDLPDQVDTTLSVLETVWNTYINDLGFRPPKSDITSAGALNPNEKLDVYLADIGPDIFGACATDDPAVTTGSFDVSAYCVLDNDYQEFTGDPLSTLQVTAAHEFFHAIQYGYDFFEDLWFMEGTAVAMEDVVFDDADDNLRYLTKGPLADSHTPVDSGAEQQAYGSWIFWRFLTEYYYTETDLGVPDPEIIRLVWEWADAAPGGPDYFSLAAAEAVGGDSFKDAFSYFGAVNLAPADFYEEGTYYRAAPVNQTFKVSKANPSTGSKPQLPHMTNHTVAIKPGKGVTGSAKLAISVDGPAKGAGPRATVVIDPKTGPNRYETVALTTSGEGSWKVKNFGKATRVILVLTNASTRFDPCWVGTSYSCHGDPTDDGKTYAFTATLKQ